jgi:hypothetical protein
MMPLNSLHRRRFTPRVEALEDRSLLSATAASQPFGTIATTNTHNQVVITDDGSTIQVFSDNGLVSTFGEGTALTVTTLRRGSRNMIDYYLLGTPDGARNVALHSSLNVRFGFGPGTLFVEVVSSLPADRLASPGALTNLGANSNVQISTTTSPPPRFFFFRPGNTQEFLNMGGLGANTILSLKDIGGGGNDSFSAGLFGTAQRDSQLILTFFGNGGNDTAKVFDSQNIQENALTDIELHGGPGNDIGNVQYNGQLQGNLFVIDDGGPDVDSLFLRYDFSAESFGVLNSQENGGPGDENGPFSRANLVHIIHKASFDNLVINSAFTNGGPGNDTAFVTKGNSPTNVAVSTTGVETVVSVP